MRSVLSTLFVCFPVLGAVYEVGPGKPLSSLGQAPWTTLQPGDTVKIYWQSNPYREKFVIARSGTEANPIVIQGVPGPGGELPVIEGSGAVTVPQVNFWNEDRGLVKVGGSNAPFDPNPGYIRIESLRIQGARQGNSFRDDGGANTGYRQNAAGVFIEAGHHITVSKCIIRDNSNGIFVASNYGQTRDIVIDANYIVDNGNPGSYYEHNTYTEALGIVYQFNRFGPLKAGAGGNNLKDRSAGLVVRYNWIEAGNRQLDLVECEVAAWRADPRYAQTFVYGNILIENDVADNSQILHYGGDSGNTAAYRKGTLYFYNNTVISHRTGNTTLMRLSTNDESADVRNNIVFPTKTGGTLYVIDATGTANLRNNWLRQGYLPKPSGTGVVNIVSGNITGAAPGLASVATQDFRPLSSSPVANAGAAPHASTSAYPVQSEYVRHQGSAARASALDLGALAVNGAPPPPPPSPTISATPLSLSFAAAGGSNPAAQTLNISNSGGGTLAWTLTPTPAWLTVTPGSGTGAGSPQVSVSIAGLAVGTHNGSIAISAPGATNTPVSIPVTLTIGAAPPPPPASSTVFKEDFETLSEYSYVAPSNNRVLYSEGLYTIGTNPSGAHNLFCSFGDHTTGSGRMMIANGRSVQNSVWSRRFSALVPGRTYRLRAFAASAYNTGAAEIQARVAGANLSPTAVLDVNIVPAGTSCPQAIAAKWKELNVTFVAPSSAATTPVTVDLRDLSTVPQGNDFTLDDIELIDTSTGASVFKEDFETLSEYAYTPPFANALYPAGYYTIALNPTSVHGSFCGFGDHTSGAGRMMIANGRSVQNSVWSRKFSGLLPGRQYKVRLFAASTYQVGPAELVFRINGAAAAATVLDVNIVPAGTSCPRAIAAKWSEVSAVFTAPSNAATVPVTIDVFDRSTAAFGNDFAIDDIELILQ